MKTPPHRPPNKERIEALHRALDVASEHSIHDQGDFDNLIAENHRVFRIEDEDERKAQAIDWALEYCEYKRPLERKEFFDLAAKLFNRSLEKAQSDSQRLGESKATEGTMRNEHYRRIKKDCPT